MRATPRKGCREGRYPKGYPVGLATDGKELGTSDGPNGGGVETVSYGSARRPNFVPDKVNSVC